MGPTRIALVGDFNPKVTAHQAIDKSFALASESAFPGLTATWLGTREIVPGNSRPFDAFHGIWCVPASPYENEDGAFWAIRFARESRVPFLGTCGGFQHALIEYARNVLGLAQADHAETNPQAALPLVSRLACSLVEATQEITLTGNTLFREAYGSASGRESYCCSFGLNPDFEHLLAGGPLEIAARASSGEARAFALRGHPFFIGTLFQPERRALTGSLHPVVKAFFDASCRAAQQ